MVVAKIEIFLISNNLKIAYSNCKKMEFILLDSSDQDTHVKQVKIAKNRHADFWRFLAIFGDFCPIFGDFLSDFMARIAKKSEILFFNKSSCRYKNRHIPIFVSL